MNNLQKNANNYNNYLEFMEVKMGKRDFYQQEKIKKYVYVFSVALVLSIVVFLTIFVMYNQKMKKESSLNLENLGVVEGIVSNDELEETSISSDLTVKAKTTNTISKTSNETKKTENKKVNKTPVESTVLNTTNTVTNSSLNTNTLTENTISNTAITAIQEKELEFIAPVSGEILKDFATDNLIYSNTLEEWTTHSGIDIKAEKMSVVVASEAGTIESIKNDPRYGLTIIISHDNGFKTVYSNLLTTEFVNEKENVEKGQTIGTVGETASFEVADEPHLHFEMYKDGDLVNPTIYLK